MRCILYARFSTDRQTEASIEDQLRRCLSLDEANYRPAPLPVQIALSHLSRVRKPQRIGRPPAVIGQGDPAE